MDTTFTIQLDCTERLERVLMAVATSLAGVKTPANVPNSSTISEEATTKTRKKRVAKVEAVEEKKEEEVVEEQTEVVEVAEEKHEEVVEEKKIEAPVKESHDTITDQDLRALMKDCRERNLASNPDDAILRKAINDSLRAKVHEFGCNSSMELSQEQRVEFAKYCSTLTMGGGDEPF